MEANINCCVTAIVLAVQIELLWINRIVGVFYIPSYTHLCANHINFKYSFHRFPENSQPKRLSREYNIEKNKEEYVFTNSGET